MKKPTELPPVHDWRTTDEQEIERRRLRAKEESFKITNLDTRYPIFSNFRVDSASGRSYNVEIRGLELGEASCQCPDFASNGLGTCKHVEAVRLRQQRRERTALAMARTQGSRRIDVVPDRERESLQVSTPNRRGLPAALKTWFDTEGRLLELPPADAIAALSSLAKSKLPDLRISQDVAPWLESQRRAEQRRILRREYELNVQAGVWPPQETRVPLFPYQREGMLHLAFTERAMLADEMGLGKTIQAIAACALLHRLGLVRRVLVVTPASLKAEWDDQIARFTELNRELLFGSQHKRLQWLRSHAKLNEFPFFTIANYEQVAPAVEEFNEFMVPDVVILDEAQRIKNWNTKLARRIKQLRSRYAFVLTGTPVENRIDDLRSLVDFLDPAVLGSLFRFNRDFYQLDERGRPAGYRNLDILHKRIRPLLLRRRKVEVETELPARTDRNHFVALTERQKRAYSSHEQEVMTLVNIAERRPLTEREQERLQIELGMMRMTCDTNFILDPEDRECPKLEELGRILEDCQANNTKVIVFSEWTRMLELVRELCGTLGLGYAWHTGSVPQRKRREDIDRFKNDPQCRVFLSSDAGATGLNLQVASTVVNCDLPWNPARLEQRIARAWRKNQTRPVTVVNLIAENTIEHRMLETLAIKRSLAESVLDQAGSVNSIPLRSGRKESMERLRALMTVSPDSTAPPPTGASQRHPSTDPATEFARTASSALGAKLIACEERLPLVGGIPVLVAVVEEVTPACRQRLESILAASYADSTRADSPAVKLEILDRATYHTIERWIEAGILQRTAKFTRPLALEAEPPLPPPLSEAEIKRAAEWRERGRHALRRTQVLGQAGFPSETRSSLLESLHALARALAIEKRLPDPPSLEDLNTSLLLCIWGNQATTVQAYLTDDSQHWQPLVAVLAAA